MQSKPSSCGRLRKAPCKKSSVSFTKLNAAKGGGFIFQSDHSVPGNIAGPDYDYVVNLVRKHGVYPLQLGEFDLADVT